MTLKALIAASVAALLSGCTAADSTRDAGEASIERSLAEVALIFSRDAAGAGRFDAEGHFVRYHSGDSRRVATVLGLSDEESIPLDSCRLVDGAQEIDSALAASNDVLELLDAGRLLIKGPVDATMMQPRHYPELTPYVTGVVYGLEEAPSLALEPGALYEVAGEGGEEVGPFAARVGAPRAFPSLEVLPMRRGGDLDLRWSEAGDASDPLVLTVAWSSRAGAHEVRCRVRDDGAFRVDHELLAVPQGALYSAEVIVTRVRRAALTATGAGRGALTLGLREVVPLPVVE